MKTMRSQKSEIDSLQLQLTQSAQKIRSSVERELRETFQTVKDERDQLRDQVKNLECSARDTSRKLAAVSDELRHEQEELQLAYSHTEELKVELSEKNSLITQEADKVTILERQLDTKSHRCNDLEREINHTRRKLEEQARSKKAVAIQTLPDAETERRIKDALDQLSRTAKERDSLRGQLNDITESSSAMQLKLENSSVTISNLESDLKRSADDISRLERTLSEKDERNATVEQSAEKMKSVISSLTEENAVLKQRIEQQADVDKLNSLVTSLERKNSELTAQVCSLTEELQAKPTNDREILLRKDEVIAQMQLDLDAERQENRQWQKDEAGGSAGRRESSVSLDHLKKQHEAKLRESEKRCSELISQVDSLRRELRALEISREDKVSKLEEKIADLTLRLSSAERRACRLEKKRISSGCETVECGVQASMEPVEPTEDSAVLPKVLQSSDTAGNVSNLHQQITALQSRVSELEQELEKSNSGKLVDVHDAKVVSVFVVRYLVLGPGKMGAHFK